MEKDPWNIGNFSVEFNGIKCGFYKISGLVMRESEYMTYQEGGVNDYVHILSKPVDKYEIAVFEKGIGLRNFNINLHSSPEIIIHINQPYVQIIGKQKKADKQKKSYKLEGTRVLEIKYSDLSAVSNEICFESISVLYRKMVISS